MSKYLFNYSTSNVFGEDALIHIFITQELSNEDLHAQWRAIRDEVALLYQSKVKDDFELWNFYIFYKVANWEQIDAKLWHTIEHDTISSRKIIISQADIQGNEFDYVTNKYIKSADACQQPAENELPKFVRSKSILSIISKLFKESK